MVNCQGLHNIQRINTLNECLSKDEIRYLDSLLIPKDKNIEIPDIESIDIEPDESGFYDCEGLFYYSINNKYKSGYGIHYVVLKFDNQLLIYDILKIKNEEILKEFENYAQNKIPKEIIQRVRKRFLQGNAMNVRL